MGRKLNNIRTMVYPEALRPSLGFGLGSANKDERHGTNTMPNNRQCGYGQPRYLKMEMWLASDLHYFLCPSWRRFGTSVALEAPRTRFECTRFENPARVISVPRRPACAPGMNEHRLRKRPLGTQGNFLRPERCVKCRRLKDKKGPRKYKGGHRGRPSKQV